MNLPIVLRRAAQSEFDDATDWYEERRTGLGLAFVNEVQTTFDRISTSPRRFSVVLDDVRQALVQRFPDNILFRVEPTRIVVLAVFHHRRNPAVWQRRV